jgi:hypothetical protein
MLEIEVHEERREELPVEVVVKEQVSRLTEQIVGSIAPHKEEDEYYYVRHYQHNGWRRPETPTSVPLV